MKRRLIIVVIVVVLSTLLIAFATAGTENDPLVTLSYLDKRLGELKTELLAKVSGAPSGTAESNFPVFEVYTYPPGTTLTFGASTEVIVRRGSAIVIDPVDNRIPDLTAGVDILRGEQVPLNHHLLIPQSDGRGLIVQEGATFWIMIKGPFTVVE